MKHLITLFILILGIAVASRSQTFADKQFYLVDSLELPHLETAELIFIDSVLTLYHNSESDTVRFKCIYDIVELNNNVKCWPLYNNLMMKMAKKKLIGNKDAVEIKYYESMYSYAVNNMGFLNKDLGNIEIALKAFNESLLIDEKHGDKEGVATGYLNLASTYYSQGETEVALEYFNKSHDLYREINNTSGLATVLMWKGFHYFNLKKYRKAISNFKGSWKMQLTINDNRGLANTFNNLGMIYKEISKMDSAVYFYEKSLAIKIKINYQEGICNSYLHLGTLYNELKQYRKASNYAKKGMELARDLGFPEKLSTAAELIFLISKRNKNYKKAFEMYQLLVQMNDSLKNKKTQKAAIKQYMKHEFDKKAALDSIKATEENKVLDAQIIAQQAKLSQEKTFKYSLFGGLGFVMLFSIFVISRLRLTRKQKAVIEIKNSTLTDRNLEIAHQKEIVEDRNKQILDSITYAERIQSAILPPIKLIKKYLPDSFVYYKPKDIVAGDFYWMEVVDDHVYLSAADCTGHGVPGAMMSVMCSNALTKCVKELGIREPSKILDKTTEIVEGRFERSDQMVLDGMDLALCRINMKEISLSYAGANNPLWIVRGDELLETKADKQPIGQYDDRIPYTNHEFQLQKDDLIYIFSDGYIDQFGGAKGKKFKAKAFKKLLLSIQNHPLDKQLEVVDHSFEKWKGNIQQIDDVCVIGVKV